MMTHEYTHAHLHRRGRYVPERDPTLEIIREYLEETAGRSKSDIELLRSCSIMSLGLAYAGTQHEEATEELMKFVEDSSDNRRFLVFSHYILFGAILDV